MPSARWSHAASQTGTVNAALTAGSSNVTLHTTTLGADSQSTAGLAAGDPISGPGIPNNTVIQQVVDNNNVLLGDGSGNAINATATNSHASVVVQAHRYYFYRNGGDGNSIIYDMQNHRWQFGTTNIPAVLSADAIIVRNFINVPDSLDSPGSPSQSNNYAVNARSLLNLLQNYYVSPVATKFTGTKTVAGTTSGSTVTFTFVNGICTG